MFIINSIKLFLILILITTLPSIILTKYDFIILSLQWPETFCEYNNCNNLNNDDNNDDTINHWLIHGLWPEYFNNTYPKYCQHNNNNNFNYNKIKSLKDELIKYWKSLKSPDNDNNNNFWSHEYLKHGTCMYDNNNNNNIDEYNYFKTTLDLYKKFNIEQWLSLNNIYPTINQLYSMDMVYTTIKNQLGFNFRIKCKKSKKFNDNIYIIEQIMICLTKFQLKPFDCPFDRYINCNDEMIGYLPIINNQKQQQEL